MGHPSVQQISGIDANPFSRQGKTRYDFDKHADPKASTAQTNLFTFLSASLWFTPISVYDGDTGYLVGHGRESAQRATGRPGGTVGEDVYGAIGLLSGILSLD